MSVPSLQTPNFNVTNAEVSAIVISRIEKSVKTSISNAVSKRKSLSEKVDDLVKIQTNLVRTFAYQKFPMVFSTYTNFLDESVKAGLISSESMAQKVRDSVNIRFSVEGVKFSLSFNNSNSSFNFEPNEDYINLVKEIESYKTEISNLDVQINELRKSLMEIPSMERRFRATLAENFLKTVEGGESLLAQVESFIASIQSEIPLLISNNG